MMDNEKKVRQVLAELLGRNEEDFTPEASLADDFNVDSTEMVDILCTIEKAFSLSLEDRKEKKVRTVQDIVGLVEQAA
jgi:acyl carrier protein